MKKVLAPKQPGFGIRDLVYIIDENRDAVQGKVTSVYTNSENGIKGRNRLAKSALLVFRGVGSFLVRQTGSAARKCGGRGFSKNWTKRRNWKVNSPDMIEKKAFSSCFRK